MSTAISVRLSDEMKERLDSLAAIIGRSRNHVIVDALQRYLDEEAWQLEEIRAGLAEADAGVFATPEEVEAVFMRYRRESAS
jgi:predicted transcriptional regulator